jgi:hypothetical protein
MVNGDNEVDVFDAEDGDCPDADEPYNVDHSTPICAKNACETIVSRVSK